MRATKILCCFMLAVLTGCQGVAGTGSYKPGFMPLKVTVDTNGNISFGLDPELEFPTPLGTFSVGAVIDPIAYFNAQSTLTVRFNDEDKFYDLHGQDFTIDFESGYYEKINLAKRGNDLLLELRKTDISQIYISPTRSIATPRQISQQQPTSKPTNRPSDNSTQKYIVGCLIDNAPARQGPATSFAIIEWIQKDECLRFNARYSENTSYDVWLRIEANQDGILFLGLGWIRADKLLIRSGKIDSLPIVAP